MPRLAIFNMMFGFLVLAIAAASGAFVASEITTGYLSDPALINAWDALLRRAAHGHANLFAMIHVLFGLTIPYSRLSTRVKQLQTVGLMLGTVAMGIGLLVRGAVGPSASLDIVEIAIGGALTLALFAVASHAYGLGAKMMARP